MDLTGIRDFIVMGSTTEYIFVGGSRGAGKTTCSCALAAQVTEERRKVLLVSVKSNFSVSDVFQQPISSEPTAVNGFYNLYAMELDPVPPNRRDLLEDIFDGDSEAKRINKTLARHMFHSFHNYDDNEKLAEVFKMARKKNFDFIVFDTASSVDTFGLWPFQLASKSSQRNRGDIPSKFQHVPKLKNTLFQYFDYDKCSDELQGRVEAMMHVHPHLMQTGKTVFLLVDTVHPLYVLGNRILLARLARTWIRCKLLCNKLATRDIPYHVGDSNYIFDVNMADTLCYFLEEYHVIKLPLQGTRLVGVDNIIAFSEHLIKRCFRKPPITPQHVYFTWRDNLDVVE